MGRLGVEDLTVEQAREELAAIEEELRRRSFTADPVGWVQEMLDEHLWSKQRTIMLSVRDHRYTAVHSCHASGKSFLAARIAAWWISTHAPGEAFVVTSASTGAQVKTVLWREIGRTHAKGRLPGRTNQTEWWLEMPTGKEEIVALGRKPSEYNPTAFQGIHARYVLVIFDEACGIPMPLWAAADSLVSNEKSRFLAIGNPDDPNSEFAQVCKPGSGWNVIGIDAFETPNFTKEWVPEEMRDLLISKTWADEKLKKWGENNPLYVSKVRGRFPEVAGDGLISISWIRAAQEREIDPNDADTNELGVDVGGGGNKSVVAHRKGGRVRIVHRDTNPDTMQTCGTVVDLLRRTRASCAKVDEIGIGHGLVDRGRELDLPIIGVNVGKEAKDKEQFVNIRAEGYWGLRERFQEGNIDIDPDDEDLAAQLVDLKYRRTSSGKIAMESKDEIKKRNGGRSPDEADAVMLAMLPSTMYGMQPIKEIEIHWG